MSAKPLKKDAMAKAHLTTSGAPITDNESVLPVEVRVILTKAQMEERILSAIAILSGEKVIPTQGTISRALEQDVFKVRQALRRLRRSGSVVVTLREISPNRMTRVYRLPHPTAPPIKRKGRDIVENGNEHAKPAGKRKSR